MRDIDDNHNRLALCRALGVDGSYLARPVPRDMEGLQLSFRKKANAGARAVKALTARVQDDIEKFLDMERRLGAASRDVEMPQGGPVATVAQMEECARDTRRRWGLGEAPIANVQLALEEHGVRVVATDTSDIPVAFDGVSCVVGGRSVVVLNRAAGHSERRRFTALHELGHLLCGPRFAASLTRRERESLCHAFAGEMLLPSAVLRARLADGVLLPEVECLQRSYGISMEAVMVKAHRLGLVSDSGYRSFCIRKSRDSEMKAHLTESRYQEASEDRYRTMVLTAVLARVAAADGQPPSARLPVTAGRGCTQNKGVFI